MIEQPPPILGSWNRLYVALITVLALQVFVYALITAAYA